MNNESGIYKLEWPASGYFYYGQAKNLKYRKISHLAAMRHNRHRNKRIQRTYHKHGEPEFTVVEYCDLQDLNNKEQVYIDLHFKSKLCCNLSPNAQSSLGIKRSDKTRKKLSLFRKNYRHPEEHKNHLRDVMNKRYSEGFKVTPQYGKDNHYFGKNHSEEIRAKMRKSKNVGSSNSKAKLVINTQTGIFYGCIKDAAFSINKTGKNLGRVLSTNRNKTHFIYA